MFSKIFCSVIRSGLVKEGSKRLLSVYSRQAHRSAPVQSTGANLFRFAALATSVASVAMLTDNGTACEEDKFAKTLFFPPIVAYEKGMLKVSDIHTIAYSCYGNPNGKPVLLVHGGPGGGTDPG